MPPIAPEDNCLCVDTAALVMDVGESEGQKGLLSWVDDVRSLCLVDRYYILACYRDSGPLLCFDVAYLV
ncbi:hypothetical protein PAXRUDRAFT_308011 [Paxillus rubicundulus Ve08.2h10]|uniref:Uncharacterized protein n=1 Tax=Paxillus rubicundulus Ve08.2h10 TaxID=930991 RepID=A0A0D0E577_9AGAM|nr:hypothetical protein PAXRUDRAFT_308011 [Paxillus rubicundulus Ve08.2h10]